MEEKSLATMNNRFDELFLPITKDDLFKLSKMYADSNLVPDCFKRKSADIVIAWSLGMPLGLSMMQCLLGIAVVNGRPTLWGDVLNGLVLSQPDLETFDEEWDKDSQTWTCTIKRKGRKPVTRTFSMAEAKVAKLYPAKETAAWTKYPKRMIQMRARGFCIRDSYSDVTSGLAVEPGELIDITDSAVIVDDKPKPAIADKIAAKAAETNEPEPTPPPNTPEPQQEPDTHPTPPAPEYRDISDVIAAYRSAADLKTLNGMIGLYNEVDPKFRDEATKVFWEMINELENKSIQPTDDDKKDNALMKKLSIVCAGISSGDLKTEIAEELSGDGRKTKFRVRDLDNDALLKLKGILELKGLFLEDD